MILKIYLNKKHNGLSSKNREGVNLNWCKATITFVKESTLMEDRNGLGSDYKQANQKVLESFLYSKCLHVRNNYFNKLIHIHTKFSYNINNEIPVESFVGSSTGIC